MLLSGAGIAGLNGWYHLTNMNIFGLHPIEVGIAIGIIVLLLAATFVPTKKRK